MTEETTPPVEPEDTTPPPLEEVEVKDGNVENPETTPEGEVPEPDLAEDPEANLRDVFDKASGNTPPE